MDVDRSLPPQPPNLQIDVSAAQAEMAAALVESPRVTKRIGMNDYLKRRQARRDAGEDSVSPTAERRDELRSQSPAIAPEPASVVVAPAPSNDPPIPGLDLVGPDQDRLGDRDVQMVDVVEPGELVQEHQLTREDIIQIKTEMADEMEQAFRDSVSQAGRSLSVASRRGSPSSGSGELSANGGQRVIRPYNGAGRFNNGHHYTNYRGRGTWNQRGRRMTTDSRNWQNREDGDRRVSGSRESFVPPERAFSGSAPWTGQRTTPPAAEKPKPQPWLAPEHSPQNRNQASVRRHSLSQQPQPQPPQQQEWTEPSRSRDHSPPSSAAGRIIADRGWATVTGGQNDPPPNRPLGRGLSPPPLMRNRMDSNELRPLNAGGFSSPPRGRFDDGPARYDDALAPRAYSPAPPPRGPPSATGRFNDRFEERGYEERTSPYDHEYDRHESPAPGPGGYGAPRTAPYDDRRVPMPDSFEREYERGRVSAGPPGYGESAFERDRFEPSQGSYGGREPPPQRNATGTFEQRDMRDRAPPAPVQPPFRDQRDRAPSYGFQDRAPNGSYREEPGEVYERAPQPPKWAPPRPRTPTENNYRPPQDDLRGPPVQNNYRPGAGDGFRGRGADGGGNAGGFRERTDNNYRPIEENNYRPMEYQQQQQQQQQQRGGEFRPRTPPPPQANW